MTAFVKTALYAALAATLSLSLAPTTVAAKTPKGLTTGTQGQSAKPNNTFCGNGDIFVIYDEDKNGNRIPGTERYGCTD
jgi:hypothetical protein